jgi:ribosomal protein S18 acetylase RimI-like enzyme
VIGALFEHARELGCTEAWVLTESDNTAAKRLYASVGGMESPEPPVMFSFRLEG